MSKPLPPETPMFPGHVKPAHVGIYKRSIVGEPYYSHWNGRFWGSACLDRRSAFLNGEFESTFQCSPWCGLTEPA